MNVIEDPDVVGHHSAGFLAVGISMVIMTEHDFGHNALPKMSKVVSLDV